MKVSTKAQNILHQIRSKATKLGDLRIIAKEIKKDHELAMELWSTGEFLSRQLAILFRIKNFSPSNLLTNWIKTFQNISLRKELN